MMRRIRLVLATFALLALVTCTASANDRYRGYSGYYGGGYNGGYGRTAYNSNRYYRIPQTVDFHTAAVRRITAYHSRLRYRTHPRSLQQAPPHPYDYRGWDRR